MTCNSKSGSLSNATCRVVTCLWMNVFSFIQFSVAALCPSKKIRFLVWTRMGTVAASPPTRPENVATSSWKYPVFSRQPMLKHGPRTAVSFSAAVSRCLFLTLSQLAGWGRDHISYVSTSRLKCLVVSLVWQSWESIMFWLTWLTAGNCLNVVLNISSVFTLIKSLIGISNSGVLFRSGVTSPSCRLNLVLLLSCTCDLNVIWHVFFEMLISCE